jgi:hypothetical protein
VNDGRFIVKVTRPLVWNALHPTALVCDRECVVYLFVPMSPEIRSLLGDEFKACAWGGA